jgi:hypothetical protein
MKTTSFLIFFGVISLNSISQQRISDTITEKATANKVTNFGLQANSGVTKYFFDSKTEKIFGNYWAPSIRLNFYFKNLFLGFGIRPATFNSKDTLFFDNFMLHPNVDFYLINGNIFIGYVIDLPKKFSVELYVGSLLTHYSVAYAAHQAEDITFTPSKGYTFAVSFNKYFAVLPKQYVVAFLNGNINKSNFSQMHADLGDSFYAIEFGLAFKGWYKKKIK